MKNKSAESVNNNEGNIESLEDELTNKLKIMKLAIKLCRLWGDQIEIEINGIIFIPMK